MTVISQLSPGSVPAGTYDVSGLYAEKREDYPRFNIESDHIIVNINTQRVLTNGLGDRGIASVSIEETPFWFIDTAPSVEKHKETHEEDFVKKFLPQDHAFPSAEHLLGVIMALIEQQPNPSGEGTLARRNRFYFRSLQGHTCDLDVYTSSDKWYLTEGYGSIYNRIYRHSIRIFTPNPLN